MKILPEKIDMAQDPLENCVKSFLKSRKDT